MNCSFFRFFYFKFGLKDVQRVLIYIVDGSITKRHIENGHIEYMFILSLSVLKLKMALETLYPGARNPLQRRSPDLVGNPLD